MWQLDKLAFVATQREFQFRRSSGKSLISQETECGRMVIAYFRCSVEVSPGHNQLVATKPAACSASTGDTSG